MTLALLLTRLQLTIGFIDPSGAVLATRDASWTVGSGESLATHVAALLRVQQVELSHVDRLAVVAQHGSLTSLRTTLAFTNALAWTRILPIVTPTAPCTSLAAVATKLARGQWIQHDRLFPTFEPAAST